MATIRAFEPTSPAEMGLSMRTDAFTHSRQRQHKLINVL